MSLFALFATARLSVASPQVRARVVALQSALRQRVSSNARNPIGGALSFRFFWKRKSNGKKKLLPTPPHPVRTVPPTFTPPP